jgi:tetratricopeptide (TPR) repeat protein
LSASFNNLASTLSALGRFDEALEYTREAVRILRQLAQERPNAFLQILGGSVSNLASRLNELGHREEALASAEEAVNIYRRLAQERPDAFVPDLAKSLAVHGVVMMRDRPRNAMTYFEQAIRLLTPLVSELPNAYAPLLRPICDRYQEAALAAGSPPDMALLAPIIRILEKLNSPKNE